MQEKQPNKPNIDDYENLWVTFKYVIPVVLAIILLIFISNTGFTNVVAFSFIIALVTMSIIMAFTAVFFSVSFIVYLVRLLIWKVWKK